MDKSITEIALELAVKQINEGVNGISICPKGRGCLYETWMEDRDCNKCWKDYLLEKAEKLRNARPSHYAKTLQ